MLLKAYINLAYCNELGGSLIKKIVLADRLILFSRLQIIIHSSLIRTRGGSFVKSRYIGTVALSLILLIISLPVIFAEEYKRIYDENGNLVYDQQDAIYREYNELNQLIRTRQNNATGIILQEYIYDPIKERIFNKDEFYSNGSLKSSTYYFDDDYIVMQNSSGTYNRTNIYQDGILVGYEDFDGKKRYILSDHEGSVHIVLN